MPDSTSPLKATLVGMEERSETQQSTTQPVVPQEVPYELSPVRHLYPMFENVPAHWRFGVFRNSTSFSCVNLRSAGTGNLARTPSCMANDAAIVPNRDGSAVPVSGQPVTAKTTTIAFPENVVKDK